MTQPQPNPPPPSSSFGNGEDDAKNNSRPSAARPARLATRRTSLDDTRKAVIMASRKTHFKVDSVGYPRWHNTVAGAAAGAGARLITAPLDLLRIRRQLSTVMPPPASSASAASAPSAASAAASASASASAAAANHGGGRGNLFSSLAHIVRTEGGIKSLFRGNVAATYLWITYAAVQFSIYARTSDVLNGFASAATVGSVSAVSAPPPRSHPEAEPEWKSSVPQPVRTALEKIASSPASVAFVSGACAGVGATVATYPFDFTRTAFASRGLMGGPAASNAAKAAASAAAASASSAAAAEPPRSLMEFAGRMYRTRGIRGFYAGVGPAVVQIVPYMGLNFAVYDHFVRLSDRHEVGSSGVAGAIAGGTSKFLVYPMDTVKKRLQAQGFVGLIAPGTAAGSSAGQYKNMGHCIRTMLREEGVGAFYRGLVPTVMKSMTATGLTFAFFTMTKNSLERIHDVIMTSEVR